MEVRYKQKLDDSVAVKVKFIYSMVRMVSLIRDLELERT